MAQTWLEEVFAFVTLHMKVIYYWIEAICMFILPHKYFRKDIQGKTVLVTGAGSGLGKLMANRFMRLGCDLVLWDINGEAIQQMAKEFESSVRCKAYTVDLSSRDQIYKAAARVKDEFGDVDILVNNAGIVTGRKFLDCPDSLIEKTMEVNANSHFWTVKNFLPAMLEKNSGHIVSIASSAGLFGVTGLADYCASKHAAVGFDESLRYELADLGKNGVHTTVVCPYFINTGMFDGVKTRFPSILPIQDPDVTVNRIMDAILCNQAIVIIPRILYLVYAFKGILPVKVLQVVGDYMGVSDSMNTFSGHKVGPKSD